MYHRNPHPLLLILGKSYRKFLGNNLTEHNSWDSLQTFGNRCRRPVILHRQLTSSIFTMAPSYSLTHSQGFHGNKESTVLASAQSAAALQPPEPAPPRTRHSLTSSRQVHVLVESHYGYFCYRTHTYKNPSTPII